MYMSVRLVAHKVHQLTDAGVPAARAMNAEQIPEISGGKYRFGVCTVTVIKIVMV